MFRTISLGLMTSVQPVCGLSSQIINIVKPGKNFNGSLLKSCLTGLVLFNFLDQFCSFLIKLLGLFLKMITPIVVKLCCSFLITPTNNKIFIGVELFYQSYKFQHILDMFFLGW